jgi:hypothetical protein
MDPWNILWLCLAATAYAALGVTRWARFVVSSRDRLRFRRFPGLYLVIMLAVFVVCWPVAGMAERMKDKDG